MAFILEEHLGFADAFVFWMLLCFQHRVPGTCLCDTGVHTTVSTCLVFLQTLLFAKFLTREVVSLPESEENLRTLRLDLCNSAIYL